MKDRQTKTKSRMEINADKLTQPVSELTNELKWLMKQNLHVL